MPRRRFAWIRRVLLRPWIHGRARRAYRSASTRADLERALIAWRGIAGDEPDCAEAHLYLGLISARCGAPASAIAHLEQARRLDADLVARAPIPLELRHSLDSGGTPAHVLEILQGRQTARSLVEPLRGDEAARLRPAGGRPARAGADFTSESERRRFRELPAITREDLARTDVDELLRRL